MRPHIVLALALLPAAFAAQANAQSRYGPASPIPSQAPYDPTSGDLLTWPGKTPTAANGPATALPAPLSPWAKRQAQANAKAAPPAAVASIPAPRPAPAVPTLRGASAPAPQAQPAQQQKPAVQTSAPAAQPQLQAAATTPHGFAGYGVPQIAHYPGYDGATTQANAAPAQTVATAAPADERQGPRFYSVDREFGVQPDPIPPPTQRVDQGGLTLVDPPTSPSLASPDDTNYQPKATASQQVAQSAN